MAMTRKEFIESLRKYYLLIIGAVCLFFAAVSPLLAYYTPIIVEWTLAGTEIEMDLGMGDPTAYDAWSQYFANIGQMGLLALAVVYGGLTANEIKKGTIINLLTKGLSRGTAIFAKLTAAAAVWTVCYLPGIFICHFITLYLWDSYEMHNIFLAFFPIWLFGVFLLALVIFGGVWLKSMIGALLTAAVTVIVLGMISFIPNVGKYNPAALAFDGLYQLTAQKGAGDILPAVIICAALIAALTAGSVIIFNKKQI